MKIIPMATGGTLYDEIDRMRVMPAMWLGEESMTTLWHFTNAYQLALRQHGIDEKLDPPFHEFHDFCARYFQAAAEAGWYRIILAHHYGQEREALGHFFPLFDFFRERVDVMKGRRVMTAFAREMTFEQSAWRSRVRDFDQVLQDCKPMLCAAYRARVAHEYDASLRDIENLAANNDGVRAILESARSSAETVRRTSA
jgi:hypothetical protein